MSKSFGLPGIRIGWLTTQNAELMETFLAAKEQIFITNSVVDEEIAYQYLLRKDKHFPKVKATIQDNFQVVKQFMHSQEYLEWVEPQGGCVCFPRFKKEIKVDTRKFYSLLLSKYSTYVGRGGWFEEDNRCMRIGFGWDKKEKLERGLNNIIKTIEESKEGESGIVNRES